MFSLFRIGGFHHGRGRWRCGGAADYTTPDGAMAAVHIVTFIVAMFSVAAVDAVHIALFIFTLKSIYIYQLIFSITGILMPRVQKCTKMNALQNFNKLVVNLETKNCCNKLNLCSSSHVLSYAL
jgi:hypothetical protein